MPALISEDGRWWWDGTRWRSRLVEGPLDLFWFTSTPDWASRILVIGLIGLIPIVGSINTLGWVLDTTDNVRRQWKELPPAGFQYLSRGVAPFLVTFLYGLAFLIVLAALVVTGLLLLFSKPQQTVVAVLLFVLAALLLVGWWLLGLYLLGSILIGSDRLGFERAIDPRVLFRLAARNRDASLQIAVTYGVATIVVTIASGIVGSVIPFGGLAVALVLPAVYCLIVPRLATFTVDG